MLEKAESQLFMSSPQHHLLPEPQFWPLSLLFHRKKRRERDREGRMGGQVETKKEAQ